MQKINQEHNRTITVSGHLTTAERDSDTTRRRHYVCVIHRHDGQTGVACVARTRLFELWNLISSSAMADDVQWYISTDPYFNRFKRVVTPRYYIIGEPEHLNDALSRSQRLIKEGDKILVAR